MNGFNITSISDCFIGGAQASAIYKGGTQLWSATADYSKRYLTIESAAADNKIDWILSDFSAIAVNIQWSKDGVNWTTVTSSPSGTTLTTLGNGEKLYLKGTNNQIGTSSSYHSSFIITKACNLSGNIMSLLYGEGFSTNSTFGNYSYIFRSLFTGCHIVSAANLMLPAYTLAPYCYSGMFSYCSYLTTPPKLPAQYLAEGCYDSMFKYCTSLANAPELPSTTLVTGCYNEMFYGCSSLESVKAMFYNEPGTTYTNNWLYGVSDNGMFTCNISAVADGSWNWSTASPHGCPSGWDRDDDNNWVRNIYLDYYADYADADSSDLAITKEYVYDNYNGYNTWEAYVASLTAANNYDGAKKYVYEQTCLLYNGHYYFVYELNEGSGNTHESIAPVYILTETDDYRILQPKSIVANPANAYVPYVAIMGIDNNDDVVAYEQIRFVAYKKPRVLIAAEKWNAGNS